MYIVSRTETFAKLFFLVCILGLLMYVALAFYSIHTAYDISRYHNSFNEENSHTERFPRDLKYILIWNLTNDNELQVEGQTLFIENECSDLNCYITKNKSILNGEYTNFDAIIFNFTSSTRWQNIRLPKHRLQSQKYIFHSKLPSEGHPICNIIVDNYFNWTWTYKFGSDIFIPFIEVKDLNGHIVAPRSDIIWAKYVEPIHKDITTLPKKAIAWMVNNCDPGSIHHITRYVKKLKKFLEEHSLDFDIYGCHNNKCFGEKCMEIIRRDYYFYLVVDESFSKDYVTAEVLNAYDYDVVPVVYGGADYTKFLPDGSYINAQDVPAEKLASLIAYTLRSKHKYNEYFQWKNKYVIHKVDDKKGFCKLCSLLNDKKYIESYSSYNNFREWWFQGSLRESCLPKGAERYSEIMPYYKTSEN